MASQALVAAQAVLPGFPALVLIPKKPKKPAQPKPEKNGKEAIVSQKLKLAFERFLERQLTLPLVSLIGDYEEDREPILPVVPDYILNRGLEDISTRHVAARRLEVDFKWERETKFDGYEVDFKWNDESLFAAHAELLHKSLETFVHPNNIKDKIDVICWMFAGDWLTVDGKQMWAASVAFSYNACCAICGYNPTVLQDFIYNALPSEIRDLLVDLKAA